MTVLLLTGFLATILMRVLKRDFVKYTRDDEQGAANVHVHIANLKFNVEADTGCRLQPYVPAPAAVSACTVILIICLIYS